MAKEVEYKKIELKVSINCCEGCKWKVKKALRNLEGVLNIDIDPLQPKITVLGDVNQHILIKKLHKVGKLAELFSYEQVEAEKKEEIMSIEKEKQDTMLEQEKQSHPFKIEKTKDVTSKKKVSKDYNKMTYNACSHREVKKEEHYLPHQEVNNFMVHPSIMNPYSNINTHPQSCYIAQPCAIAIPYYAIPSYSSPSLPQASVEEHHHFDMPRFQPPFLRPKVRVGDYFSDENTLGCYVM